MSELCATRSAKSSGSCTTTLAPPEIVMLPDPKLLLKPRDRRPLICHEVLAPSTRTLVSPKPAWKSA
jgi:hypothetical protein